ncbi:hypothetical protein [Methylopila sp. M107]|uniref:hypothetical protein n=1 Tax=Methylopila sp. M107 TaxID=1101190 RepID=UPI000376270B|nr:hypothetical protein [Methylopila sp. M107]
MPPLKPAIAMLVLMAATSPNGAAATEESAERLVGIALVTEWVAANCPAKKLSPMLLATTPSVLKQLEPDKLALGRKRVADRAARFPSKAAACRRWTADLEEIQ